MAAEQAASVVDQEVIVVRSKTVPQGMAAMLAFNPVGTLEENEENMKRSFISCENRSNYVCCT